MTRTFTYNFTPPSFDPSPGATIALDLSEIEDAGIREVLQTISDPARALYLGTSTSQLHNAYQTFRAMLHQRRL
ncbi:hypothetical protein LB516_20380 [Mesorhizobium sp. CO1-1-7]|uniref:hypothetical protein n=1 Tax=unclassified Mesorhizobium TaxID=325217 RepID=UPI0011266C78|nr:MULTISPECIES: hypothetical protein [unclassified Mesorhizobium]MBZ9747611.1 hypothetical protein [Mesorhizobium sp. CO1-1-7]TPK71312.1 hypothetical protein FJ527_27210 [Mesorhizobium sp. B2-4-18]